MTKQAEYLNLFSRVAFVYEKREADPLWTHYPDATTSIWDSLGVFLEGYAFERQGRSANFSPAAADVVSELRLTPLDPSELWRQFQSKIKDGGLNVKNNPVAPKGTAFTDKKGKTFKTEKYSAAELAITVGAPLVCWVRSCLQEDRVDQAYAKFSGITGVGPKIASYFLRDVACRFGAFPTHSRWLLQPIDIWVYRSVELLGTNELDKARFIVNASTAAGVGPEAVNQGMWYFGAVMAGSEYVLRKAFADVEYAKELMNSHLESLSQAVTALIETPERVFRVAAPTGSVVHDPCLAVDRR